MQTNRSQAGCMHVKWLSWLCDYRSTRVTFSPLDRPSTARTNNFPRQTGSDASPPRSHELKPELIQNDSEPPSPDTCLAPADGDIVSDADCHRTQSISRVFQESPKAWYSCSGLPENAQC